MSGWEFARYFLDKVYEHWIISILFLCIVRRVTLVNLSSSGENEKKTVDNFVDSGDKE